MEAPGVEGRGAAACFGEPAPDEMQVSTVCWEMRKYLHIDVAEVALIEASMTEANISSVNELKQSPAYVIEQLCSKSGGGTKAALAIILGTFVHPHVWNPGLLPERADIGAECAPPRPKKGGVVKDHCGRMPVQREPMVEYDFPIKFNGLSGSDKELAMVMMEEVRAPSNLL
jgi:hypothetical protein